MVWPLFVCYGLHVGCLPCPFLCTGTTVWPLLHFLIVTFFCAFACCTSICVHRRSGLATFAILHQFFTILQFSTLGPLKLLRLSAKVDGRQNCQKQTVYDTFVQKNWTVLRGIATFIRLCPQFGRGCLSDAFGCVSDGSRSRFGPSLIGLFRKVAISLEECSNRSQFLLTGTALEKSTTAPVNENQV